MKHKEAMGREEAVMRLKYLKKVERQSGYEDMQEALDMAIDALKKAEPLPVNVTRVPQDVKVGNLNFKAGCKVRKCPTCDSFISNDIYCRYCGQRLKREESK